MNTDQRSLFDPKKRDHSARLEHSPRLQRVLVALEAAGNIGLSTRELIHHAHVCAVNSCIDELRDNGYDIRCERVGDVWNYWLERKQEVST